MNDHLTIRKPNDKKADRERIENLYLSRQITKAEFDAWLRIGGHQRSEY